MENTKQTILLVDDEPDILEFLSYNLRKNGYEVFTANNGKEGIELALKTKPDLIVLDVMMPVMDGMETCNQLRTYNELGHSIIVFLTARSEDYSQIAGLNAGADDYISKPIKPQVFMSKIKSLLRRAGASTEPNREELVIKIDEDLVIDKERYLVIYKGKEYAFPRKEFELLLLFSSKANKVFTRVEIFSKIWGDNVIVGDRTIDVHIRKIREKIGSNYIQTVKGVGYKFITH